MLTLSVAPSGVCRPAVKAQKLFAEFATDACYLLGVHEGIVEVAVGLVAESRIIPVTFGLALSGNSGS